VKPGIHRLRRCYAAVQSSLPWLVVGLAYVATMGAVAPRRIGPAARKGQRLRRAAVSGGR
jgi:hypothetical protein